MGHKQKKNKLKFKARKPDAYFINALAAESDRGCVLVACAFLEYYLELLLKSHLMKINPDNEKLIERSLDPATEGSLFGMGAAKAKACLLLGLITKYDSDVMAEIRNIRIACAHHPGEVPLNEETVEDLLGVLTEEDIETADWWIEHDADPSNVKFSPFLGPDARSFSLPRVRFSHACLALLGRLSLKLNAVEERPFNYGLCLGSFSDAATKSQQVGESQLPINDA